MAVRSAPNSVISPWNSILFRALNSGVALCGVKGSMAHKFCFWCTNLHSWLFWGHFFPQIIIVVEYSNWTEWQFWPPILKASATPGTDLLLYMCHRAFRYHVIWLSPIVFNRIIYELFFFFIESEHTAVDFELTKLTGLEQSWVITQLLQTWLWFTYIGANLLYMGLTALHPRWKNSILLWYNFPILNVSWIERKSEI